MYISTYYKRNATLERNDGRTTAFVAPDDKFDPNERNDEGFGQGLTIVPILNVW